MIQRILHGRWLYLLLAAAVLVIYTVGLPVEIVTTVEEPAQLSRFNGSLEWWPKEIDAVALRDLVHERLTASAPRAPGAGIEETLTRREIEILKLMGTGLNTRAAADRLHVSGATIRNHVQNIFGKLGVHSRLEAVAFATQRRWL